MSNISRLGPTGLGIGESPRFGTLIKMTIAVNGNVGIGVTRPELKLHVKGTTYLQNVIGSSILKIDNLNNAFGPTPQADVDIRVDTMRMFDASGIGTNLSSSGYRRIFGAGFNAVTGNFNIFAPPVKNYDRFIICSTSNVSNAGYIVEIGLNNYYTVTSGGAPYIRIGATNGTGTCMAIVPAGVQVYIGGSKSVAGTMDVNVYEIKLGRNDNTNPGV